MTPDEIFRLVVVLLSGAGTGVIIKAFMERRKLKLETEKLGVDAAAVLSTASLSLLQPMQDRIKEMNLELAEANLELTKLKRQVRSLTEELQLYRERENHE